MDRISLPHDGRTKLYAVMGDPVSHSLSPAMHNAAFVYLGLNNVYLAFRVKEERLGAAIAGVRELGLAGLNVTIPHKRKVIQFLDAIDGSARDIGAVNTIINDGDMLKGYNTDGDGALDALRTSGFDISSPGKVLLIGAGESARAIGHALGSFGKEILITNRNRARAEELARCLSKVTKAVFINGDDMDGRLEGIDLMVNCTPVGMKGFPQVLPIDEGLICPDMTVMDIVYTPFETELLKTARKKGARTVPGLEMLINQGRRSFELWTGKKAPEGVMREVVLRSLFRTEDQRSDL